MVAAKNSKLRGRALARQDKDRALEELEIELDSVEEKPIAKGSQGAVHKASYQGDVVALKKMSLVGITATKRNKMMKDFSTELAIISAEINHCVRPAWRYYLLFWQPRCSTKVLGVLARGVLGLFTRTFDFRTGWAAPTSSSASRWGGW